MTLAINLSNLANNVDATGKVSVSSGVVGTLPIANGGTGATTAAGAQTALSVPSTTGTGASGTWPINITGNAATASNGGVTSIIAGTGISVNQATGAVTVTNNQTSSYVGSRGQVFTSSGTFTVPAGVTSVKVTCIGGGGGSGGYGTTGGTGGTSSFGSYLTSSGGTGGVWNGAQGAGGTAGGTNNSSLSRPGGSAASSGSTAVSVGGVVGANHVFNVGGDVWPVSGFTGGPAYAALNQGNGVSPASYFYGCGAAGSPPNTNDTRGGGGAALAIGWVTGLTAGGTVTVAVGAAGAAAGGSLYQGSAGAGGVVIVEY